MRDVFGTENPLLQVLDGLRGETGRFALQRLRAVCGMSRRGCGVVVGRRETAVVVAVTASTTRTRTVLTGVRRPRNTSHAA